MPYPDQHAARQQDPTGFSKLRRGVMDGAPDGIDAVYGSKDGTAWEIQSIRADSGKLTAEAFRTWLEGRGFKTTVEAAVKAAEAHPEGEKYRGRYKAMNAGTEPAAALQAAEDDEDEDKKKDKPFGGKKAPPFKAKKSLQDDDDDDDEEAKAKAKAEAKAKAKAKGRAKGGRGGMGNPTQNRYYTDAPVWGVPYAMTLSDGPESWVEIVRSGNFFGSSGPKPRRVHLAPEAIDQLASNFSKVLDEGWFTGGCPVGYNHASAMGDRTPEATRAAARIKSVEVRPNQHGGVSLWGLFAWTPEGADRIRGGEFAAISAELLPPESATSKITGEPMGGWTLVGATMTNTPFIPGMTPVNLPDTVAASEGLTPLFLSELEAPEMPDDSPLDVMQQLAEITGTPAAQILAEVQRLQVKADRADALEDALTVATDKITTLSDANSGLEDREKTRILDEACSIGRIAPADRENYWQTLQTVGADVAHRWFAEGTLPVTRQGAAPTAQEPAAASPQDAFLALMDQRVADGLSDADAYAEAKARFGGTLYPTPAES